MNKLVGAERFKRIPLRGFLNLNKSLWSRLPKSARDRRFARAYGDFLHAIVTMQETRDQLCHTFFLRNRPALELIARLAALRTNPNSLRVAILGCSAGAEAYSIAWKIHSAFPRLRLDLRALDISEPAIEIAKAGRYSTLTSQFTGADIFDRVTEAEMRELFDKDGDIFSIKPWIKEGITWHVGDATDPKVAEEFGDHDIVIANNFLCHMEARVAERCLLNIGRLVAPGGYLFVSGVDINIRMKVAQESGWQPVDEMIEEIHNGDPRMRKDWPFNYSSLEPLNKGRRDWRIRYASAFCCPSST